ncbi:MAG TPA: response regulator, partial [Chloroflexota bacterium]|nr:response regulator [Chloroflexota bacterium]
VVLDLRLPGLDGETVARELYRNGFRPPVLILSAGTRDELSAAARRLQAYATLSKPFDLPDLVAKLRQGLDLGVSQEGPRRIPVRPPNPEQMEGTG